MFGGRHDKKNVFLMWFGRGTIGQLIMLVFYCSLMLLFNTLTAIKNLNPIYTEFAYTLGAKKMHVYRTIVLPGILPENIGGMRVVIGFSWGIQIVAELMGSPKGMGQVFTMMVSYQAVEVILAGILWISLIAFIIDFTFNKLASFITRWSLSVNV